MAKQDPSNITMYNISKKLVKDVPGGSREVRFRYPEAFDGYAGVEVPRSSFTESANNAFWHIRMPKDLKLTMTYKDGIRRDQVASKEVSPREFKDMFEKTRTPKKKKEAPARGQEECGGFQLADTPFDMDNELPFL